MYLRHNNAFIVDIVCLRRLIVVHVKIEAKARHTQYVCSIDMVFLMSRRVVHVEIEATVRHIKDVCIVKIAEELVRVHGCRLDFDAQIISSVPCNVLNRTHDNVCVQRKFV